MKNYKKNDLESGISPLSSVVLFFASFLPEPIKGLKENPFLDSYVIEFLDLPKNFKEADLRKGLIQKKKKDRY